MRLLADENFDRTVIQALRHSGHDVRAIGETNAAAPDELVIEIARNEGRVLLTEDKDFGDLVYNRAQPSARRDTVQTICEDVTGRKVANRG